MSALSFLSSNSLCDNVYSLGHRVGHFLFLLHTDVNEYFPGWDSVQSLSLTGLLLRYKAWWFNLVLQDPIHVLVETLLVGYLVYLLMSNWQKEKRTKMKDRLTDQEIESLLKEWKEHGRVPLEDPGSWGTKSDMAENNAYSLDGIVVHSSNGSKLTVSKADMSKASVLNFATHDFLGLSCPDLKDENNKADVVKEASVQALKKYGCGSCGPRGFYGTIDAHLDLENAFSKFTRTSSAILYSDGASCSASTVAAFANRGDLLVVDEGVYEALGTGINLSRANVKYFKHNDMEDLRRVLERIEATDQELGRKKNDQRRFIVVEGIYKNYGTICPLDELIKLKEEFCYRLILDDSFSFGVLGDTGRGVLEHFGLKPMKHAEIICVSLENSMGSIGGITVGNEEVVDHQRLSGAGYCFSASLPPFLACAAQASLEFMENNSNVLTQLKDNVDYFYKRLESECQSKLMSVKA